MYVYMYISVSSKRKKKEQIWKATSNPTHSCADPNIDPVQQAKTSSLNMPVQCVGKAVQEEKKADKRVRKGKTEEDTLRKGEKGTCAHDS